ncbi:MAG TPA: ABC transporter substrate-binding protein/permease, partial [Isosphaeraceae bacterium]|nr:ABC transporter substrate-binding protein/permease [Isosphaeraceae bacterium]
MERFSLVLALLSLLLSEPSSTHAQDASLDRVRSAGVLRYGCDAEGGGPYAYPDPNEPSRVTGFEVELMERLCGPLGPRPDLYQGQWDSLLPTLGAGHVDVVVNGYEWTPERSADYRATRPYYIFQLQWMVRPDGPIQSEADLKAPRKDGNPWKVAVLGGSSAETHARELGEQVSVQYFNGATDAMMAVQNGQADATLQDLPAARFYRENFPGLTLMGEPVGHGFYVMYLRNEDATLLEALNHAIERVIASGELEAIYRRYDIWTEAQNELASLGPLDPPSSSKQDRDRGVGLIRRYGATLLVSAGMTVFLSFASMPLAMAIGLMVALGRLYGPSVLRSLLAAYVETIRGTPLMLQLFVLFFLLPKLGLELPALVAGIGGLAINYSAYEAEIYRAGLQAIPAGQMEAALALGMSRGMALRRVIVPQAVRIVIPPVTNDFIALFKDTSVCSVISVVELTKRYSILANSTGGVVEFAIATAVLYMA